MEISSSLTALNIVKPQAQDRATAAQPTRTEGHDKENDGDKDDVSAQKTGASVTATRGQKINITA